MLEAKMLKIEDSRKCKLKTKEIKNINSKYFVISTGTR